MIDFYFMIHYVVYRFYRKRSTYDRYTCLLYAFSLHILLSGFLLLGAGHFLCKLFEIQNIINKPFLCFYVIISLIFESLVFCWKDRYLKVFTEYEKQIDTPAMKRKMKNAKIFNYSIFIVDIIMLFIGDYLNHHGGSTMFKYSVRGTNKIYTKNAFLLIYILGVGTINNNDIVMCSEPLVVTPQTNIY